MYNTKVQVELMGLLGDRALALVDKNGHLLTGRTHPTLARLMCSLQKDELTVSIQDEKQHFRLAGISQHNVQLFDVNFMAERVSRDADEWFSELLNLPVQLVRNPDNHKRLIKAKYQQGEAGIRMSDAAPILLINRESLNDLNKRLAHAVDDIVFRPNIVVKGLEAYRELKIKRLSIGGIRFKVMSSCKRCKLITLNYDSYDFHPEQEPLRTLSGYMTGEKGAAVFGVYLVPEKAGELNAGDRISILD